MRFPWLILLYLLFPGIALAQYGTITGKVINAETKSPLPRASVFLSNSAVGSATQEDGSFTLGNIRQGQYTMVVSILGYEQYEKTVLVGPEPIRLNIELTPKPLMLREVVIQSSADWKKNFESFKKEFIGTDDNAKYCEILNPHILNLTYNPTKRILHADADEFLIIENKALGYRIKYLLNDFIVDGLSGTISKLGRQLFENLPGSDAQKKRWHEKREDVYYGSSMHFFRSLYNAKLTQEGFSIYRFKRYPNPLRPSDEVIRHKLDAFNQARKADSAKYYYDLANQSKYTNESLMKPPLSEFEIYNSTGEPGLFQLHFYDYLYVVYNRKTDDIINKDIYRPLSDTSIGNHAVSVVTLNTPFAEFDKNGILVAGSTLVEGAWSRDRMSVTLPYDYVPDHD